MQVLFTVTLLHDHGGPFLYVTIPSLTDVMIILLSQWLTVNICKCLVCVNVCVKNICKMYVK